MCNADVNWPRFHKLIFAVLLTIFAHWLTFQYFHVRWMRLFLSTFKILSSPEQEHQWMVSLYWVCSATERRIHWTHVQLTSKILKCWQCVAVLLSRVCFIQFVMQ